MWKTVTIKSIFSHTFTQNLVNVDINNARYLWITVLSFIPGCCSASVPSYHV